MTALLELSDVSTGYGRVTVVRDVSLTVGAGQTVCLLGRNGAGKTTLLRALMGLLPHSGSVRLYGSSTAGWSGSRMSRQGVAWVPQEGGVVPGLTIAEHFKIASRFRDERAPADVLARFPVLGRRLDQQADTLSGGERKLLGLALAMVTKPRLVLLDEPTEGVAPIMVEQIVEVIHALLETTSVLLVEQNLDTALQMAAHAYVLEHGSIVASGDLHALHADGTLETRLAV
jgi:branched-chain amino acid transport system ATP-binding protein